MHLSKIVFEFAEAWPILSKFITSTILKLVPIMMTTHWALLDLKDRLLINITYRTQIDGLNMVMDPLDGLARKLIRQGLSEPGTTDSFKKLIRSQMVIVDAVA